MNSQEERSVLDVAEIEAACSSCYIKGTTERLFVGEYRPLDRI